ncbi:hypothetical protein SBADM41S_08564 [Streptomyces badius]
MGIRIQQAEQRDRGLVVSVMEEAFHDDPVSSWVFPDEAHRRAVHGKFLGVFVDVALDEGRIDIAEDDGWRWLREPHGRPSGAAVSRERIARRHRRGDRRRRQQAAASCRAGSPGVLHPYRSRHGPRAG